MFALRDVLTGRAALAVAASTMLFVACSGSSSTSPAPATAQPITGSYVHEGHPSDVLVLEEGARFCVSEKGVAIGGTYEVDGGGSLTLHPEPASLGDEAGTIDAGVVTDPDGERWMRSDDAPACEPTGLPGEGGGGSPTAQAVAATIMSAGWLEDYADAAKALGDLPATVGGYRSSGVTDSGQSTSVAFPDPTYAGPASGVSIVVTSSPGDFTAAQMVDATAHLGFGLRRGEMKVMTGSVPMVIGQIESIEGPGKLPTGHEGFLAVWAPKNGNVVYAVIADSEKALQDGVGALAAVAT